MSTISPELDTLLRVLDDRGTGLGRDDVAWAFESSKTKDSIASWVREYLSSPTLLTREEAAFNEKRGTSGTSQSHVGPVVSDEDFESAINSLEASTASIERQCKLLEAQKRALQDIQARNASSQTEGVKAQRSSKFKREKGQAEFEASELSESLHSKIERSLKQSQNATDGIHSTVERILEKDNRLLDGLQKVLPQLADAVNGPGNSDEVERLCQALTSYSSAEIHARIDAAFHTAAKATQNQANGTHSPKDTKQIESLQAELEELCREIDGLSTMAVDNQFRNPISKALGTARSDSNLEKAEWLEYMSSMLQYLTARLESLEDGTFQLRSQNSALKTVSTALDGVLAMAVDRKQSSEAQTKSPSKSSQKGLKPLRLVQANLSESQDPAAQLLRQLDVRASDSRDATQLSESLDAAVREKNEKLSALTARTESNVSDQISRSIAQADGNARALLSGVYAYSPYDTINLVNGDVTDGISQLEKKTQSLSDEMRELDVDKIGGVVKEKQKALLEQ